MKHRWRMTPDGERWPIIGVTGRCLACEGLWTPLRAMAEDCPGKPVFPPVYPPDDAEHGIFAMLDRDGRPQARRWDGQAWRDRERQRETPAELARRGLVCWGAIRRRDATVGQWTAPTEPEPAAAAPSATADLFR